MPHQTRTHLQKLRLGWSLAPEIPLGIATVRDSYRAYFSTGSHGSSGIVNRNIAWKEGAVVVKLSTFQYSGGWVSGVKASEERPTVIVRLMRKYEEDKDEVKGTRFSVTR